MPRFKMLATLMFLPAVAAYLQVFAQESKIKPGDVLEIIVYNNRELSQTVVVTSEGTVDFPFLQGVPVKGMTLQRFQEFLVAQLSRYMDPGPLATVRFTEAYPVKVTVLGQVSRPGVYSVPNISTMQGAIGQAGGFMAGAQLSHIKLIRAAGENGNDHKDNQIVNMEKFYLEADPSSLPILKDGDIIVVPGNPLATSVKVLGGVVRPGSYEVPFRCSLLDVLFLAGGPTNDANLNDLKVVSLMGQSRQVLRININDLLTSKNFEAMPFVVPGDVVYIPEKTITWRRFMNVVRDAVVIATLYVLIREGGQY